MSQFAANPRALMPSPSADPWVSERLTRPCRTEAQARADRDAANTAREMAKYPTPWTATPWTYERASGIEDHGIAIKAANGAIVMSFDDVRDDPPSDALIRAICAAVNAAGAP